MARGTEKFGEFVRRKREEKEIGLREMAKMIGVSPTYLSKVERDEFPPPAEDKVQGDRQDHRAATPTICWRGQAGCRPTSPTSSSAIPCELAALLRTTKGLTADDMARLARQAQKAKDK